MTTKCLDNKIAHSKGFVMAHLRKTAFLDDFPTLSSMHPPRKTHIYFIVASPSLKRSPFSRRYISLVPRQRGPAEKGDASKLSRQVSR